MSCGFLSQALRWLLTLTSFTPITTLTPPLIILLYSLPSNQQPKGGEARKKNYAGVLG